MGYSLTRGFGWNNGYRTVFYIQIVLTAILFISLPLWKRREDKATTSARQARILRLSEILKIPGVKLVLITFFSYCALESTAGLWASSYLVEARGIDAEMAARFASLFYLGITIGRFLSGFITDKLGDRSLIRLGLIIILIGITMVAIPIPGDIIALIGIVIIGLGCAPVYPCVIHATPSNFGESNSQAIIGVQMASAYVGTTLMPPVFGFLADYISIGFYPFYLLMFAVLMIALSEKLNATIKAADIHLHQK
jgi:fucose permease